MAGVRSGKTVTTIDTSTGEITGTTEYKYTTLSGKLVRVEYNTTILDIVYDESGQPFSIRYKSNPTKEGVVYYYVLNAQGDVIGLLNSSGELVVEYKYDPWGKLLETIIGVDETDSKYAAYNNMGLRNPLRYRGYIYDRDTGFYYLQSRYYDPEIGRFINADTYTTTDADGILSSNMFAYCENNPVMGVDPTGEFLDTIFDVVSLGMSIAEVVACPADPWAWAGLVGDVVDLIPCVTGVGETVRAAKASKKLAEAGSKIINKKYAGTVYKLSGELAEEFGEGIRFSKYGFPDFSEHAIKTTKVQGLTGKYAKDAKLANAKVGLKSTPKGYTWHHVEDGRTMQLIPQRLHNAVRHTGGCAVIKYL